MFNELIDDKTCSAIGRDCCLDLVIKFVDRANGCNWTSKFIVSGIYSNILSVNVRFYKDNPES